MDGPASSESSYGVVGLVCLFVFDAGGDPNAGEKGGFGTSLDLWTRLQYLNRRNQTLRPKWHTLNSSRGGGGS